MYERMLDKQAVPTMETLTAYCGENGARFVQLCAALEQACGAQGTIVFPYGNRYGWGVSFRRKKKLICNVFAENGAFTVMMRLSDAQFDGIWSELGADARTCVAQKYPCGDGGWVHFRVTDAAHLTDVLRLLRAKGVYIGEKTE